MSDRIDRIGGAGPRLGAGSGGEDVSAATGNWRGETVRVESGRDVRSLIDMAKEELGSPHSEAMQEKKIEERVVEEEEGRYGERVDEVGGVWKFLGQLPDMDLRALAGLIEDLEKLEKAEGVRTDTPDRILALVAQHFEDPAHVFAALEQAEQRFRTLGHGEFADAIKQAKDQYETEHGPEIRAGLNVTAAAFEAVDGDRLEAQRLRDLYRDTVFNTTGPAAVYKGVIDQFGTEEFPQRIKFLTRALGDDLSSAGPSVEPTRLHELIGQLSDLRVLDTVHERCGQMVDRLHRQNDVPLSVTGVMQELLPLTAEPVSGPTRLLALPGRLGIPESRVEAGIALLRETREVMALVPTGIYRDLDARASVLRGIQEAMDELIEREEEAAA
jgi:type III secretion protein W